MRIVGLDLAGSHKHPSGVCVLSDGKASVGVLHTDDEIILTLLDARAALVAIDAPLSFPKEGLLRTAEKGLHRRGIKCFPPLGLKSMEMLTIRGKIIASVLRKLGTNVIEVFPGAAWDIWGIGRDDANKMIDAMMRSGLHLPKRKLSQDELDAVACAVVGKLFLEKKTIALGEPSEGVIHIPKRGAH